MARFPAFIHVRPEAPLCARHQRHVSPSGWPGSEEMTSFDFHSSSEREGVTRESENPGSHALICYLRAPPG